MPALSLAARTGAAALRANPVRALLATLGVVIGSGALVSILAVGDGVEAYARQRALEQGLDRVTVRPITEDTVDGQLVQRASVASLTVQDLASIAARLQPGEAASLVRRGVALIARDRADRPRAVSVQGIAFTPSHELPDSLVAGRHLTAEESRAARAVAVVNVRLARALLGDSFVAPGRAVGDSIPMAGTWLRIVGVVADPSPGGLPRGELRVIAPLDRVAGDFVAARNTVPWPVLTVQSRRVEDTRAMRARVEAWLGSRDRAWARTYRVESRAEWQLAEIRRAMLVFRLFMGAITGITLIVGGIGIMNVLLASVAERTREIGVRKAVGARRRDILLQFLAESVTISGVGGAVGTAVGLATAYGVTAVMRSQANAIIYAATTPETLLLSVGTAVLVGVAFGCYPAARAARLAPIEAIHVE